MRRHNPPGGDGNRRNGPKPRRGGGGGPQQESGRRQAGLLRCGTRRGGLHHSNSTPALDVSSLLRAARLAHRTSYDALSRLEAGNDEVAEDEDSGDARSTSSTGTEVVAMLEDALDGLDSSSCDDETSDDDDDVLLMVSVPFCSGGGGAPHRSSKKRSRRSPNRKRRGKEGGDGVEPALRRQPSEVNLIPPQSPRSGAGRVTVILDLDETLVWARNATVVARPFLAELLHACLRNHCEVVLWTAGIPAYVNRILNTVSRSVKFSWFRYVICRSALWYSEVGASVKDLRLIERPLDRILVIENCPASIQLHPDNVLLVEDFYGDNPDDQSMLFAGQVVERVCHAIADGQTVASALRADPVVVPVTFLLAADHSASGQPAEVTSCGLRYSPRTSNDHRVYSGVGPTAVGA